MPLTLADVMRIQQDAPCPQKRPAPADTKPSGRSRKRARTTSSGRAAKCALVGAPLLVSAQQRRNAQELLKSCGVSALDARKIEEALWWVSFCRRCTQSPAYYLAQVKELVQAIRQRGVEWLNTAGNPFQVALIPDTTAAEETPFANQRTRHVERRRALEQRLEDLQKEEGDGCEFLHCRYCGGAVAWIMRQTRSADEGMSCFCECMRCRKRWKM